MPTVSQIEGWTNTIQSRYENYLKTSFYFKDAGLRESFRLALQEDGELIKGPIDEVTLPFKKGIKAIELAEKSFPSDSKDLVPALQDAAVLHAHQQEAIQYAHIQQQNIVVATGTGSGKTECFLYPILFDLYQQHLEGALSEPGVRAMILYPMNALANDQRERLGAICQSLKDARSEFRPTFGQYIGQTPEHIKDTRRNAVAREENRLAGELVFRDEMRQNPPHILLTNYSMLEYLLIRPDDSPLFDMGRGKHWKFIVLDEAHQYRGTKGMEMGMLVRRLKQRLIDGGRQSDFRCIATSATISSGENDKDKQAVAEFATELFGETFSTQGVVFAERESNLDYETGTPSRYHVFMRALEGAFLINKDGNDEVVLNRSKIQTDDGTYAEPLEIALCKECGQHYYVGRERNGMLIEAIRDPSQTDFGVEYYLPLETQKGVSHILCRRCGTLSSNKPTCGCGVAVPVKKCPAHKEHADQLKKCEVCDYQRGGIGDPVQEIVHGSDGPNAVIATVLHELLPENKRKVLAFADSRQEAAFFAWYAEDSYRKLRDRNLMLRAFNWKQIQQEGLSIQTMQNRLIKQWEVAGVFEGYEDEEDKELRVLEAILSEGLTDERRISLTGVGMIKWSIKIPSSLEIPEAMLKAPWNFNDLEAHQLLDYLLDSFRTRYAMTLPSLVRWSNVSQRPQVAFSTSKPMSRKNVRQWGGPQSATVKHFLYRLLEHGNLSHRKKLEASEKLMRSVWNEVRQHDKKANTPLLKRAKDNGTFQLDSSWLRIKPAEADEVWECKTCASISTHNIRGICPRNQCPGNLALADQERLAQNHYRILYESSKLPPTLHAEEHTAQIDTDVARERQDKFKNGRIHILSSSTTFEVGVDLGDLETVFLRNVPPESFNYTQRVGRAGRRETPGFALTYCRRNPHDLYHYESPEERVIRGEIHPPRLSMTNEKIILRHMAAVALSAFFKNGDNYTRFKNVETFIGDWQHPKILDDLKRFCEKSSDLKKSLLETVPQKMHTATGLDSDDWIDKIAGTDSRLRLSIKDVCMDYQNMENFRQELFKLHKGTNKVENRIKTITNERTLEFLSRKAVIPKYGFPVDVVELDTRPQIGQSNSVSLQRDLSQAIAEYAPGGKVVANKKEWESYGIKVIPGQQFPIRRYSYDDAHNFQQWDQSEHTHLKQYISPIFGFVTQLFKQPTEPQGKTQRLYTTRPFFEGFEDPTPNTKELLGVSITPALPGTLVILCEGRNKRGFYICLTCGTHTIKRERKHDTPAGSECGGTIGTFSLGHELVTDIVRMQFTGLTDQWQAYSLAYAIALGASETIDVPDTDLNVTITGGAIGEAAEEIAIVLYDNVPGGAGLVTQLEDERVFKDMISSAQKRVEGNCGCDSSCYGCLRSYRNQFAHPHLDRTKALKFLQIL